MKKQILLSIAISLIFINGIHLFSFAQESHTMHDTISMEPGRTYDVYYSLKNGETKKVIRDDWDIGFSTRQMDVTIRTNGANGIELYTYPNSGTSGWETVDTAGLSTWPVMYNDDTDWENGAFNRNASSHPDYGWGIYNMITHNITGDSLFVVIMPDGKVKKLWIVKKNPSLNQYTFKYADMDGSGETEKLIELNNYSDKNFIGFSFSSNDVVNREPVSADWDLVFTKYITFYGGVAYYPITGILENYNVQVAAYPETDTSFIDYSVSALDSFNISTIGNHWYSLEGGMPPTYKIEDSLVFFVSDKESNTWKLVFEYYDSNMGEIGFRKQLIVDDTTSITYDVYYSLNDGEIAKVIRENWDIGFSTRQMDVAIRTNGGNGIKLFTYPNSDISGWETVDTARLSTWPVMYNDDTDWENGAFNRNASSHPDYGWGIYNMTSHNITGDSLFVLQMPDGKIKKLWIVQKNPSSNQYTFKYADLDGSGETEKLIELNNYSDKNFIGYSFATNDVVDREPVSASWDLVFTRYIVNGGDAGYNQVAGLLQNYNVQVAVYPETDTSFIDYSVSALDSLNISTIGNNWYSMLGVPPTVNIMDSLVYFVSDQDSKIYKLIFEYYDDSLGEIGYKKQLIEDESNISEIQNSQSGNLALVPNPTYGNSVSIMFNADRSGVANVNIFNLTGSKVADRKVIYQSGLNNKLIDISDLPKGAYVVMMTSGNVALTNKLIVQ